MCLKQNPHTARSALHYAMLGPLNTAVVVFEALRLRNHPRGTDSPIWDLYSYGPDLNKHQVLTSCLGPMIRECGT